MSTLNFNVAGDPKDDQPTLIADNPPGGTLIASHFEGVDGQPPNRWVGTVPPDITGGAWVTADHGRIRFRVILPPGDGPWEAGDPPCMPPEYNGDQSKVAMVYRPAVAALVPLDLVGRFFRQSGARCFLNGATGFNVPGRFAYEGSDALRGMLAQRQALGFNAIRLWSAYNIALIGRLIPREFSDFYSRIVPGVSSLCAEYGQYPYWTGLTGPYSVTLGGMPEIAAHDQAMQDALSRIPFALYDRRNEYSKDVNQIDMAKMGPLWLPMASQGSGQQDEDPPTPYGRFAARHPAGSEQQRKVGKQGWDSQNLLGSNIPWVDDEVLRYEPGGENRYAVAEDSGQMGAGFIAGAFFHSSQAKLGIEWTANGELVSATGWCAGVARVVAQGLDIVQDGAYLHRTDLETASIIRAYERRLGDRSVILTARAA